MPRTSKMTSKRSTSKTRSRRSPSKSRSTTAGRTARTLMSNVMGRRARRSTIAKRIGGVRKSLGVRSRKSA